MTDMSVSGIPLTHKVYMGEIPINMVKNWNRIVLDTTDWGLTGWSGNVKEPFRHWTSHMNGKPQDIFKEIWDCINYSFIEDGFNLNVHTVIANLYNHGDSSWLHTDSDKDNAWTAIIYLNDFWDLNWGGHTVLIRDNEVTDCFAPTPGKFILFKGNLLHGPTPVSREAPYPRLGVTFQTFNDNNL